jgi:hypothetical protein
MTKSEWEKAYTELDKAYRDLALNEREYKYGSNQKIRDKTKREMGYAKHNVEYLITKKYPELFDLITGGTYSEIEFFEVRHIVGDLGNLLKTMKEKIKSFDNQS